MSNFRSTYNRGFQMTFENGLTISVQWGFGNYCERRSMTQPYAAELKMDLVNSKDAEIAIWNAENVWFDFGTDQVMGWVSSDDVSDWISAVKNALDLNSIITPNK